MARHELILPKMGEGIIEATINKWLKEVGDDVNEDDAVVEVATDKVDSEIPSPVDGVLVKLLFGEGEVAAVGDAIAIIETDADSSFAASVESETPKKHIKKTLGTERLEIASNKEPDHVSLKSSSRFLSPLVKSIAKAEGVSLAELEQIKGSGKDNRLVKQDVLAYLENRNRQPSISSDEPKNKTFAGIQPPTISISEGDQVLEMDRMRRMIADHMVMSAHVSPHVTSFIDVDVTNVVNWRNKIKDEVLKREGEKITFTPVFINAVAQALMEYPQVNASLDGYKIILRKRINIGMAAALPNGNLIVPVIKDADQKNILGTAKTVNDLASRARENKLQPTDIQGGTFTLTNFGSFDSLSGTPIINQPQVAILGVGAIRKKPVVIETASGDMIGIRHIMILSMAYDHRIVDGALGGMFLRRVKQLLENFDINTVI
ncbi:MAG: 2-oxo acid dehydrogenase subunit E2 [Chlorobi bacterium]|nr:2-oxo acid dehydrogenase subunit E2 [Chlorobiota bacterium]